MKHGPDYCSFRCPTKKWGVFTCANSRYQALFWGLGTRLSTIEIMSYEAKLDVHAELARSLVVLRTLVWQLYSFSAAIEIMCACSLWALGTKAWHTFDSTHWAENAMQLPTTSLATLTPRLLYIPHHSYMQHRNYQALLHFTVLGNYPQFCWWNNLPHFYLWCWHQLYS